MIRPFRIMPRHPICNGHTAQSARERQLTLRECSIRPTRVGSAAAHRPTRYRRVGCGGSEERHGNKYNPGCALVHSDRPQFFRARVRRMARTARADATRCSLDAVVERSSGGDVGRAVLYLRFPLWKESSVAAPGCATRVLLARVDTAPRNPTLLQAWELCVIF